MCFVFVVADLRHLLHRENRGMPIRNIIFHLQQNKTANGEYSSMMVAAHEIGRLTCRLLLRSRALHLQTPPAAVYVH